MSYTIPKEEDRGEFLDGTGCEDGDECFCSLKLHSLMTQTQCRTVVHFDIARLPLRARGPDSFWLSRSMQGMF